jgi:hypothetical protein
MRKTVLAALVSAAVMVPAAALAAAPMAGAGMDQRDHGGGHGGGDRGGNRGSNNGGGGQRPQSQAQPQQQAQQQARPQYQQQARPQYQPQGRPQNGGWNRGPAVQSAQSVQAPQQRGGQRDDGHPDWNRGGQQVPQQVNGGQRNDGHWNRSDNRGAPQANRGGYDNRGGNWNRGWRNDNRYDWNRYRYSNRNAFHLPRYYAPYGWGYGYRRFSVGAYLADVLFAENYWIDDPFYYHLPPAYGEYRWVRYYNDALLVDIYTGEVVDEVDDIFW